jgi:2-phospho-L-lactate transferase/gluconeogenesis factor (CofD/UPF0052 family)
MVAPLRPVGRLLGTFCVKVWILQSLRQARVRSSCHFTICGACGQPSERPARASGTGGIIGALNVILFSGGRGSGALTRQLVATPGVSLTIAINGYDDGASTGEVRRFLGDSLGPSDFRKNASRLSADLSTCDPALIAFLDSRLAAKAGMPDFEGAVDASRAISPAVFERLQRFCSELARTARPFCFDDCSVGNLVFAGGYLLCERDFNRAVDDYSALVGLRPGLIENVTDGTNAWLVAIDEQSRVLATEEAIVDTGHANRVRDIFLLGAPLSDADLAASAGSGEAAASLLQQRSISVPLNPRLAPAIAAADLIIYAPGTQHSSLFPSYLTQGLGASVAANLRAIKLLLTNIQPDAEIQGSSAVEIIDRAVHYLKEKGRLSTPTPCLITHYLVNDPGQHEPQRAYVPLGPLESIEDPRLVRIGNYEDGITGRHDATRVLTPFLQALSGRETRQQAAVLLHDAGSPNKVVQTLLEMVRGGIDRVPIALTVFYAGLAILDAGFIGSLPFVVQQLQGGEPDFHRVLREGGFDYAILFESSGMYRGEDLVAVAAHLAAGRLDAVWGSRRLSVRDIEESYRLRYRRSPLLGVVSFMGSHVLSLGYLFLFGRYIADTLSGVRAVRASDAAATDIDLTHKDANHQLLSRLLRRKADVIEIPVQFFPISPERVKRTTIGDGLRALWLMLRRRVSAPDS